MNFQLGGQFGYQLLKLISRRPPASPQPTVDYQGGLAGTEKLERFLGHDVWQQLAGNTVLDLGCGHGAEAVAAACAGARMVIGTDVQEGRLQAARHLAREQGVADKCLFLNPLTDQAALSQWACKVDVAYSLDAFEHFGNPHMILAEFHRLLRPGGSLLVSFGPPWKHPYGGHMRFFNRWPWVHLLFREETLMQVRALYRADGARRFADVDGGLNQMTIRRFLRLVAATDFQVARFQPVPFSSRLVDHSDGPLRLFAHPWLREYLTSVVRCQLIKPVKQQPAIALADQELVGAP